MFTAKFPGTCGACTEHIHPGDDVEFADDSLVHAACVPPSGRIAPADVCGECFTAKAVNGECGCD